MLPKTLPLKRHRKSLVALLLFVTYAVTLFVPETLSVQGHLEQNLIDAATLELARRADTLSAYVFFANKQPINTSDIFIIRQNEQINKNYSFDGNTEIEIHLLDAGSKQELDRAVVKKYSQGFRWSFLVKKSKRLLSKPTDKIICLICGLVKQHKIVLIGGI